MNKLFRATIVLSTLLYIVFCLMPYFDHLWVSQEGLDLLTWNRHESNIPGDPYTSYVLSILWLIIAISLFFFINAARIAFVLLLIISAVLSPFSGFAVYTAIHNTIVSLLEILDGALLVMMYFTSVSYSFTKTPNKSLNQTGAKNAPPG